MFVVQTNTWKIYNNFMKLYLFWLKKKAKKFNRIDIKLNTRSMLVSFSLTHLRFPSYPSALFLSNHLVKKKFLLLNWIDMI